MKALLLNSGTGTRMGTVSNKQPKCMTELKPGETILSRQLQMLCRAGVDEFIITTGLFNQEIQQHAAALRLPAKFVYVNNARYAQTNYIYSIYLAMAHLQQEFVLLHGDLVFAQEVADAVLQAQGACVTVSSTLPLPQKDFKAVLQGGIVEKVGVSYFTNAVAAQPFYRLPPQNWRPWADEIIQFCESGNTKCYAEDALNNVWQACGIAPLDVKDMLCQEVDTPEDLAMVQKRV